MNRVAVVADSVAALPQEVVDKYNIHIIPVRLTIEGKVYQDTDKDLPPEMVQGFQKLSQIDTTPWSPEFYFREYEKLSQKADNIVHVVCFSQFTSTISLAKAGAKMAREAMPHLKVEVFDSATATMAQGFIALAVARAAANGKDINGVVEAANAVKSKVNSIFAFDTLDYLARTGRINKLAAWASSLLKVKPLVGLSQGEVHPLSLVRSWSQAIRNIIKAMRGSIDSEKPLHVAIMDVECPYEAEELANMGKEQFQPAELYITQFTPVMQIVAGPDILGVAFYCGE
jgi:DegV family protein with EDD domain